MKIMRDSTSLPLTLLLTVFSLHNPTSATSGSEYNYGAHPRFVCTPLPTDADPSCFSTAGPGAGSAGPGGPNQQNAPPSSWLGVSEEAKTTILHLRESLVQQKEIILNQRETIRELTAKLSLCEVVSPHDERHSTTFHHETHRHAYADNRHYGNQQVHHRSGNLIPDSPHHPSSVGGQQFDGGKGKHVASEDSTSSVQQMERMLQALKERLNNLQQKRNTSTTYSSSLKELLQRKISILEEQLHRHTAALSGSTGGDNSDDDEDYGDKRYHRGKNSGSRSDEEDADGDHDDDDEEDDNEDDDDDNDSDDNDDDSDDNDDDSDDDDDDSDDNDDDSDDDSDDDDDDNDDDDTDDDDDDDEEREDDDDDDDDEDEDREDSDDDDSSDNEADSYSYLPHTYKTGFHSNKLETMLHQLHLKGSNKKKFQNLNAFQISFPMRTNYMYGRMKKTLMQEIFALTLCLWMKAGVGGPGLGTPFSYSAPGQANELVLIEWGNNPIELLIDDKAVSLPLSLNDGKWHHVCVTWTTRDGQWEAYQDGVQRGSGMNLSPWRSIKPGGVFILGQEQDTLGGRFDASQSYVGEMSDLHMWSHVLSSSDIYSLASCGSHLRGDVITWSETEVELHGGVARHPFDPCH